MNSLTLPDVRGWNAGTVPNADLFNQLADGFEFAIAPPEVRVICKAALTTGPNYALVTYDTVVLDNCAAFGAPMWVTTLPSRLTCQVPGWYEILIQTSWTSSSSGDRRIHALTLNNNGGLNLNIARSETLATGGNPMIVSESPMFLRAADYIELIGYSDTASTQMVSQTSETPDLRFAATVVMKWVSM